MHSGILHAFAQQWLGVAGLNHKQSSGFGDLLLLRFSQIGKRQLGKSAEHVALKRACMSRSITSTGGRSSQRPWRPAWRRK